MKHLTVDEILDFVSLTELNNQSIELSTTVNGHIRKCEKCRKLVRTFQMIHDEFSRCGSDGNFKEHFVDEFLKDVVENESAIEVKSKIEELDGYK